MGGTIMVGMRGSDGAEHLMTTWTNFWPEKLATLGFLTEGAEYKKLIAMSDPKRKTDAAYPVRRTAKIHFAEYGLVLIDFKDRAIFSANDYFTPGKFSLWGLTPETAENVLALHERGLLIGYDQLRDLSEGKPPSSTRTEALLRECRKTLDGTRPSAGVEMLGSQWVESQADVGGMIAFKPLDMTITDGRGRPRNLNAEKAATRAWLKEHNWSHGYGCAL